MTEVKCDDFKASGYVMFYDAEGNPSVQDPFNIPDDAWNNLSNKDKEYITKQRIQLNGDTPNGYT